MIFCGTQVELNNLSEKINQIHPTFKFFVGKLRYGSNISFQSTNVNDTNNTKYWISKLIPIFTQVILPPELSLQRVH